MNATAGLFLFIVVGAIVLAVLFPGPRHAAGCNDPGCTGCWGGPR